MTARTSDLRWLLKDALRVVSKRKRLIFGLSLIVALGIVTVPILARITRANTLRGVQWHPIRESKGQLPMVFQQN